MPTDSDVDLKADQTPTERPESGKPRRKMLGKYELIKQIGAGGMGAVYLANDMQLRRSVAIKVLPRDKAKNDTLVRRFEAEAQSAAQLQHDNIVRVYEAGEADGFLFIALEYVEGTDVHNLIAEENGITVERSVEIIRQAANGLQHAFKRGIVHRDIKPSNLLIGKDGIVKLTDLGLARSIDETLESNITRAGTTVGTVDFMAPEQARSSKAADIRSDIYSLGCTWYQMLTARPPFGGSLTNKLFAHATRKRPDPRDIVPDIPQRVVDVLHRMMERSPKNRYQSPAELLEDLDALGDLNQPDIDFVTARVFDDSDDAHDVVKSETEKSDSGAEENAANETVDNASPVTQSKMRGTLPSRLPLRNSEEQKQTGPWIRVNWSKYHLLIGTFLLGIGTLVAIGAGLSVAFQDDGSDAEHPVHNPFGGGTSQGNATNNVTAQNGEPDTNTNSQQSQTSQNNVPNASGNQPSSSGNNNDTVNNGTTNHVTTNNGTDPDEVVIENSHKQTPAWVTQIPTPSELASSNPSTPLTVIPIGLSGENRAKAFNLNDALRNIPASGAVIQLLSEGPFLLKPTEIAATGDVVIAAASSHRPLIYTMLDDTYKGQPILQTSGSRLMLSGIDLFLDTTDLTLSQPIRVIDAGDGDLTVLKSSVTVSGKEQMEAIAFHVNGPSNNKVYVNDSIVRGNQTTAFELDTPSLELFAENSVFVTGTSPVVRLSDSTGVEAKTGETMRRIKLKGCSTTSQQALFEFQALDARKPAVRTEVVSMNCLFGAQAGLTPPTLLRLKRWPRSHFERKSTPDEKNLQWLTEDTLFAGWVALVSLSDPTDREVRGHAGWQHLWKQRIPRELFVAEAWPSTRISGFDKATLSQFGFQTPLTDGVASIVTKRPGTEVRSLSVPSTETIERGQSLSTRPEWSTIAYSPWKASETMIVNVGDQDLGRVLETKNLAKNTLVIVRGSGVRYSSPIRIANANVRFQFESTGEDSLVMIPQTIRPGSVDPTKGRFNSLFSVINGSIEIIGGRFRMSESTLANQPNWFLYVQGGTFSIWNCEIRGPVNANAVHKGLVRWVKPAEKSSEMSYYPYRRRSRIVDSFLIGYRTLMDFDLRDQAVSIQNSTCATVEDAIRVRLNGFDPYIGGAIDVQDSTFSVGGAAFHLESNRIAVGCKLPLRMFVDRTLFAPAMPGVSGNVKPSVIACADFALTDHYFRWWGQENVYDSNLQEPIRIDEGDTSVAPGAFANGWDGLWDREHVQRPLFGAERLRMPYPSRRSEFNRKSFVVPAGSGAATWTSNGSPAGASMEPPPKRKYD